MPLLLCLIEVLSHANKHKGENRDRYLAKRQDFLDSYINFVEIDLLRANQPMPLTDSAGEKDYRLFIRRSDQYEKAFLYAFNIRNSIPLFAVPLKPKDEEPILDIGKLLKQMYIRAGYDMLIDYTKRPKPVLRPADALWADRLLGISVENNGHR
ncbi:MAG: DUF4058 family protein [Chloroflexota bacterium]